jgi:segregation and condensation protein B
MDKLKSQLESLLFIAAKPLTSKQLAEWLETKPEKIVSACQELANDYKETGRGIQLTQSGDKFQLVSSPDNAEAVQKFIQEETGGELSRPSLEALTIIAYRGPVSKFELDRIRGVNCSLIVRNLLIRGLIESKDEKGETYYNVTLDFLRFLGVGSVQELPDYERLHNEQTINQVLEEEQA